MNGIERSILEEDMASWNPGQLHTLQRFVAESLVEKNKEFGEHRRSTWYSEASANPTYIEQIAATISWRAGFYFTFWKMETFSND